MKGAGVESDDELDGWAEWCLHLTMKHQAHRSFSLSPHVDLWRAVGIAATGDWSNATDEELENVVRLLDYVFGRFASVSTQLLHGVEPPLAEAWRRVESGRASSRLADWLAMATHNVARSSPVGLLFFFTIAKDSQAPLAQRFAALYNAGSNVAKLWLLNTLLYALVSPVGLIVAAGSLNTQVEPWRRPSLPAG